VYCHFAFSTTSKGGILLNILYLVSIVLGVSAQDITRKAFNQKNRGVYLFSALAAFFAMAFFAVSAGSMEWNLGLLPYAVAFAASYGLASVCSVIAVATGSLSITTLVISYSLMLPTLYGLIFLREPIGPGFFPGLILLIISLLLINKRSESVPVSPKWIISLLLAFVGNGACSIVQKMQQNAFEGAFKNEFMILSLLLVVIALLAMSFKVERPEIRPSLKNGWWLCLICGAMNGMVNLFVMILSGRMPVSIMFPVISAGGIILTSLISMLVYHEKLTRQQLIGLGLGIATVILLNL